MVDVALGPIVNAVAASLARQVAHADSASVDWGKVGALATVVSIAVAVVGIVVTAAIAVWPAWRTKRQQREAAQRAADATASGRQGELRAMARYVGAADAAELDFLGVAASQAQDRSYLPRPDFDELIRTSLAAERFVVVTGESAAGKSRSALEAARQLWPQHTLVAPIRAGLPRDGLRRIVELVDSDRSPVILWLDDLDQYLAAGALTVDLLSSWAARSPGVTVLATMQAVEWGNWRFPTGQRKEVKTSVQAITTGELEVEEVGAQAAAVLGQATRVELARTLQTAEEREEASRRYGPHDWAAFGLGEVLAAGPDLLAKLHDGRDSHPWGYAIAEAAMDWRQTGVGRPITSAELKSLAVLYLPEWASRFEDFGDGLAWVTAPIKPGSEVRIVYPRFRGQDQHDHFEIHEYVAASRRSLRLGRSWPWLLRCESITAQELMRIAATADSRRQPEVAIAVYGQVVERFGDAPESALREQAARALVSRGLLLMQEAQVEAAVGVFDQVVERYGEAPEPALREQVARALINKGFAFGEQGPQNSAIAVFEQVMERYGEAPEPALRESVAMALVMKGIALGQQAQPQAAVGVFDQVAERYSEAPALTVRGIVSMALVAKGIALHDQGQTEAEVGVYEQVVERYGEAPEPTLRQRVAMALVAKGIALHDQGQTEAEVGIYDEVVERYGEALEPALREQVARALVAKGIALGQQGQSEAAVEVNDEVVEWYGEALEPALRKQVARALVAKGIALGQQGQPEAEVAVYDQVVERYGGAPEPAIRERVASALVNKGITLDQQGQPEAAIAVYDQVVERCLFRRIRTPGPEFSNTLAAEARGVFGGGLVDP